MNCFFFSGCKRTDAHVHCVVPHCARSIGKNVGPWTEWICRWHWIVLPRRMKRILSRARRLGRKTGDYSRFNRLWRRIRREAINRGLGLK